MTKRIFIVDDAKEFLSEIKEMLTLGGYDVDTCSDSESAVDMITRSNPDLIVLDLKMNGKNGFQIADELTRYKTFPDRPIIAITGHYTEKEHLKLMTTCGIQRCVTKPCSPLELIFRIEAALKD